MKPPLRTLRDDDSAVSEVMGTILILGMTVSLFAVIIVWVTSIPTPTAATRLDLQGSLIPQRDSTGQWAGVNITLTHGAGEALNSFDTRIYLTFEKVSGQRITEILKLRGIVAYGPNAGSPYGLIDGTDDFWNIGERWAIVNKTVGPQDRITAQVIDLGKSAVLWTQALQGPAGSHPPLFLEKWADYLPFTTTPKVLLTGVPFVIFAHVTDEDSNIQNVTAALTIFYGTPSPCKNPQKMYDDGTNGDVVKGDGIYTLSRECMTPTNLTWDGSIVLFSATDGTFTTTSRMALTVRIGPGGSSGGEQNQTISGRPPNLRYNGLQGYNIFNATEWNAKEFNAKETRTFKGMEQVVVVIGSYLLKDAGAVDQFFLFDPYGGSPPKATVYGTSKVPTYTTKPTNLQAFRFYKQVNGYNIFIFKFDLNNASTTGINYYRNPVHPPFYYFARYSLTMEIMDSYGQRFNTTDSMNITDQDGYMRQFPIIETYRDAAFTVKSSIFTSTDRVYVAVSMYTVDANADTLQFGVVSIRDFIGGTQIQKAFINFRDANPPLCAVNGWCGGYPPHAISVNGPTITYRFMVNLTLADEDPWVPGQQNYAMTLSYVHDTDETYTNLAKQLLITSPLYKMDIVGGNSDTTNPSWGTHDYGYYYTNVNGLDKWAKNRYEFCGLPGTQCKSGTYVNAVAMLDADQSGTLDLAADLIQDNTHAQLNYYRRQLDSNGNVVYVKFTVASWVGQNVYCAKLTTGDLTGDGFPEIVCGMFSGTLYYFKNDGTWTSAAPSAPVTVDSTPAHAQQITGVVIGDFNGDGWKDIAVSRMGGTITYYLNLDGLGTFSTGTLVTRHFAQGETIYVGTITVPDYLKTYNASESPSPWEQLTEASFTEPSQGGNTTNAAFTAGQTPWVGAHGAGPTANSAWGWLGTGGNPGGLVYETNTFLASTTVSGYWYQAFTISGSTPFSATIQFDRKVSQWLTSGAATSYVYVYVDPTPAVPTPATAIQTFQAQGTTGWLSSGTITVPTSKIPTPGTYYLKLEARVTFPAAGAGSIVTQFDNAQLNWTSTGGQASELLHYWRMEQIPNRPFSTYTITIRGHRSTNSENDNFAIAYATNVAGGDPRTGTYTTLTYINTTTDVTQLNLPLPNIQNKIVWLRATDTNHTVANPPLVLDTLYMDQIYIEVTTQPITPGSNIAPLNPGDFLSLGVGDQDSDGFSDLVAGTSKGGVWLMKGSPGGFSTPGAPWYTVTGNPSVLGVKFGNVANTSAAPGLEIVLAYGTSFRVITGGGTAQLITLQTISGTTDPITALGVGDIDGNGIDDVALSTGAGNPVGPGLVWFRNLNGVTGTQWRMYNIEPYPPGTAIALWDIALGDGEKSQYMGR